MLSVHRTPTVQEKKIARKKITHRKIESPK